MTTLVLDWASHDAAAFACRRWHYARRMPPGKTVKIGVWEDGSFRGVVIFAPGAAGVGSLWRSFGLPELSVCELQRIALREHVTPVTRIVSIALRMLKRQSPGIELVVSYADPAQGHEGKIYHAGNWFPWGKSAADKSYRFSDGKIVHRRSVSERGKKTFGAARTMRKPSQAVAVIDEPPKWRFLYPLGERGKAVVERLRAKQAMAGTTGTATRQRRSARSTS